MRGGGY